MGINKELYDKLIKQYQDITPVTYYLMSKDWVERHLERLCSEFSWLSVGGLVKHTIDGETRVSKIERFIVNQHNILVDTGFGNIWYYECKKPTTNEIKKFDGHCLCIKK